MSCLINCCIRNRSLNVWFVFVFITWVVCITNLKCLILKVRVHQWEGHVTWISSVSTCVSQGVGYIRVIISDVAWKWDIAFTSMDGTCEDFWTIRFLHNTQVNIWISWKATSDGRTIYCKSSIVVKVCFSPSWMICLKELPYTESETISVWIQSITRFAEGSIFNCCAVCICNNWNCRSISSCWNWCQLCSNCWSTIYSSISSKSSRCQGCHHVIYWLAQTFALIRIWLSRSIGIDQAVACCQFCLNFSNCGIKSCFLFRDWNCRWVVACDLVQQDCFWSILFQNNFVFSLYRCSSFWSRFRSSYYSWFTRSCWNFCWSMFLQWSWVRSGYTNRSWSARWSRSTCWFCCRFSSWFCSWFRLRFSCWSCTKDCTSLLYKCLARKLRSSHYVWSSFISFCSVGNCSCTKNSSCCYNSFQQATTSHFCSRNFVFTNFSYDSLFNLTTNDFQKTKVRSRSTQPVFTWFDQFETSHTIRFTEFTVRTFKKHFCLLIYIFYCPTIIDYHGGFWKQLSLVIAIFL